MTPTLTPTQRPVPDDDPIVEELFRASRPDLALLPPELTELQLRARTAQRRAQHPHAVTELLLVDGEAIGALVTATDDQSVRVVDIVVAEPHRGAGLGTSVLGMVIDQAHRGGRTVRLQVWSQNTGARRLYERLGFRPEGDQPALGYQALSLRPEETARHG